MLWGCDPGFKNRRFGSGAAQLVFEAEAEEDPGLADLLWEGEEEVLPEDGLWQ